MLMADVCGEGSDYGCKTRLSTYPVVASTSRLVAVYLLLSSLPPSLSLLQYQRLRAHPCVSIAQTTATTTPTMRLNPSSFEGTSYTITEFPRPSLRRLPNTPVTQFDDAFRSLANEMKTIMYAAHGVGLAAPQVGLNQNFFVSNPAGDDAKSSMERVVCNPVIDEYSTAIEVEQEGCLSLRSDDCAGMVARAAWIQVSYQNELGQQVRRRLKGFEARVFQHEYDHLNGILCWDRFSPEDRKAVQANIDKLLGLYEEDDALVERDESVELRPAVTVRQMPPLKKDQGVEKKKKSTARAKTGFGGGAVGGTKGATKKKKGKRK